MTTTKEVSQHTPTPWHVGPNGSDIRQADEMPVPLKYGNDTTFEELEANAAFIVRAVNVHEENEKTIAILKRMLEKITGWTMAEISKEIAIKLAEGK